MCAGLLIRTVGHLLKVDPGFEYAHSLKMDLGLPALRYSTPEKRIEFYRELTKRVQSLPGVVSAGAITPLPVAGALTARGSKLNTACATRSRTDGRSLHHHSGYLQALNIPLRHGREITTQDDERAALVMLVSEGLAARFWPNRIQSERESSCRGIPVAKMNPGELLSASSATSSSMASTSRARARSIFRTRSIPLRS